MFQGLAKTQSINRAWAVFIDLGGGRFPAGKAVFSEALDDLAQSSQDRVTLEVTGAATLGQPRMQTHPCGGRGCAIGPTGDAESGGQLPGRCRKAKAKGGTLGLTTGRGGQVLADELFYRAANDYRPPEHLSMRAQCVQEGGEGCAVVFGDTGLEWIAHAYFIQHQETV